MFLCRPHSSPFKLHKIKLEKAEMITMKSDYLKCQLNHPYRITPHISINALNVSQNFHVDNVDCSPTSEKL